MLEKLKKINPSVFVIIIVIILITIMSLSSGVKKTKKTVIFNYGQEKNQNQDIYALINQIQKKIIQLEQEIKKQNKTLTVKNPVEYKVAKFVLNHKIAKKMKLKNGNVLVITKDGKKFVITPKGKIIYKGQIKIPHKKNTPKPKEIKLKPVKNKISEIIDTNGNKYIKTSHGWIKITPDGKKEKINGQVSLKNGHIYINGKKAGEIFSYKTTKEPKIFDKKGNLYTSIPVAQTQLKLSKVNKILKKLKPSSKKLLANGDILITAKNGKQYLITPDGKVIPVKNVKRQNGHLIISTSKGKIKTAYAQNQLALNKLLQNAKYKKTYLDNGDILVQTPDGKKYLVTKDGKIIGVKKVKFKNGKIIAITNNGKITAHKINLPKNAIKTKLLKNGDIIVTTANGKKYLITKSGKKIEISGWKVKNGKMIVYSNQIEKFVRKLAKDDIAINQLLSIYGKTHPYIGVNGNLVLKFLNNSTYYLQKNNSNYFNTKIIKQNAFFILLPQGKISLGIENKVLQNILNGCYVEDLHETQKNGLILFAHKRYWVLKNGDVYRVDNYKINPNGTITIFVYKKYVYELAKSEKAFSKLKNSAKILYLQNGDMLVNKNGKKYLITKDGKIIPIKQYALKNGNLSIKGYKTLGYLAKIFKDKNGYYVLDQYGHKHYIKYGYIKNNKMVFVTKDGKKHILDITDKNYLIRANNNKIQIIGIGSIKNVNGHKRISIKKIFYKTLGIPVRYLITANGNEYETNGIWLYKNGIKLGIGKIYLNKKEFIIYKKSGNIYISKNKVRNFKFKTIYLKSNGQYLKLYGDKIYILYPNGSVSELKDTIYTLKNGILKVNFLMLNNKMKFKTNKYEYQPFFENFNSTSLIETPEAFYILDKKYQPLLFKVYKENINPLFLQNNIRLENTFQSKILGFKTTEIKAKISPNLRYLFLNGFYHNGTHTNKTFFNKTKKEISGYLINKSDYYLIDKPNIIQITPKAYFVIPMGKINVGASQEAILKENFKAIFVKNINQITLLPLLTNGNVIYNYNNEEYMLGNSEYKKLGNGNVEIMPNGAVYLIRGDNSKFLGRAVVAPKYIFNGIVKIPYINKKEIKILNKLNNSLNSYFSVVDYGVKIFMKNNKMAFYDSNNNVIYIDSNANVNNLGKGRIFINKKNKKVYFISLTMKKFLGYFTHFKVENNIVYLTTNGLYYIYGNDIYQILNKNKLNDLGLIPDVENGHLYGADKNGKLYNLGQILKIYVAKLNNGQIQIVKEKYNYLPVIKPNAKITNKQLSSVLFVRKGIVYKKENEKTIPLGKLILIGKKYIVVQSNGKKYIYDKLGNKIQIIKTNSGIVFKDNGKIIHPKEIKVENNKVYFNGKPLNNLVFTNPYRKHPQIKILNPKQFSNLFEIQAQKRKAIISKNPKYANIKQTVYEMPKIKYHLVMDISQEAAVKNTKIFFNNKKTNKTIYINADTGAQISSLSDINQENFYLVPGIKVPVTLAGGSLAPLNSLTQNSSGNVSQNQFVPKSFFVITKNIVLPSGKVIPMNGGIIVATPIPTAAQRMFYKTDKIYFYDRDNGHWYVGNAAGQIVSAVDNVPGLPGVLIDTRNKYIAKATIYSILEGISQFINNVHSPISALQNQTTNTVQTTSVSSALTNSVLAGAGQQMKNLSQLFLAIIKSQVPYLAVQSGQKGYFITDGVIEFKQGLR